MNGAHEEKDNRRPSELSAISNGQRYEGGPSKLRLEQDVAVTNYQSQTVSVLLGNGDGTFRAHVDYLAAGGPAGLLLGDFNRDGAPDLAVGNGYAAAMSILSNTGGTLLSTSSSANPSTFGQPVTFTTNVDASLRIFGQPQPSGTVIFKDGAKTLGSGQLSNGGASFTTSSLSVGKHTINAFYSGDGNFRPKQAPAFMQQVQR
jgi:hypothetical protein